jgi:hypothetical protein
MEKTRTAVIKKPELPIYFIAIIFALTIAANVALTDSNGFENAISMTAY